jgi:hypothetical protein
MTKGQQQVQKVQKSESSMFIKPSKKELARRKTYGNVSQRIQAEEYFAREEQRKINIAEQKERSKRPGKIIHQPDLPDKTSICVEIRVCYTPRREGRYEIWKYSDDTVETKPTIWILNWRRPFTGKPYTMKRSYDPETGEIGGWVRE